MKEHEIAEETIEKMFPYSKVFVNSSYGIKELLNLSVAVHKAIMAEQTCGTSKQQKPKGKGADIANLVSKDIESRAQVGEKKYGERLLPFNGRNALWDAYQEALDLCMYLRQCIEESEAKPKEI